jgi:hypothetical protein
LPDTAVSRSAERSRNLRGDECRLNPKRRGESVRRFGPGTEEKKDAHDNDNRERV